MSNKKVFKKAYSEVRKIYGDRRQVSLAAGEEAADWKAIRAVGSRAIDAFFDRHKRDQLAEIKSKCYWRWHDDAKREWNGMEV